MATYNFSTTARQDAAIDFALTRENARRAAQNPPQAALTAAQYLGQLFNAWVDSYEAQAADVDITDIQTAYKAATPAKRAQAKAAALAALQ